jgi:hypothetical protein
MRTLVLAVVPTVALVSCAPSTALRPAAPGSVVPSEGPRVAGTSATRAPDKAEAPRGKGAYLPLFDELVAKVRRYHVFADGQGAAFERSLDRLRAEAARAETEAEGMVALAHLQKALGDRHCNLSPPSDVRPSRFGLGLALHTEREASGRVRVRVEEVKDPALEAKVHVGDELVTVDGAPVEAWLTDHPFESNALNPDARLSETAHAIVMQIAPWTTVKEGDTRKLVFANAGELTLPFRRPFRYEREESLPGIDDSPAMGSIGCTQDGKVPYAGYELASLGVNYCTYRPKAENRAAQGTRIVRFVSFMYPARDSSAQLRWVRVDHDGLVRDLAGAKRVVLDVHENHLKNTKGLLNPWFSCTAWKRDLGAVPAAAE